MSFTKRRKFPTAPEGYGLVYVAVVRSTTELTSSNRITGVNIVEMRVFSIKAAAYRWLTELEEAGQMRWRVGTVDECPFDHIGPA